MAGTGLFGWCLPGASKGEHEKCLFTFEYGRVHECPCLCHTDATWLETTFTVVPKKKRSKK